ncbi:porin family protein, partial [Methylobacterium sp. J-026]|nr:porin family protein [Methylobacterium sp. J-026]
MKSLLRATTALAGVALAGSAFAADLPRRAAPPPGFTPVPVVTWTGPYSGINAGYAFYASSRSNNNSSFGVSAPYQTAATTATFGNRRQEGFSGGAPLGSNYQLTPAWGSPSLIDAESRYLDV